MRLKAAILGLVVSFAGYGSAHAQVVWSDEFNGDEVDLDTWTYDVGGHGFGNGQLEYDTARRENSYVKNGSLVIEARREDYFGRSFTSARMLTQGRFAFHYGTLEARIKVPDTANGLWPAFWMLGNNFPAIDWPNCGEMDILEIGGKDGIAQGLQRRKINCAIHFSDAGGRHGMADAWLDADVDLNDDYHLYKISWTPEHVKFYLDGVEFGSWDITPDYLKEFHQPCFPILNVAVGSWDSSYTGIHSPDAVTASFPAKMYVDWIRLSANPHTKLYHGKDIAETGNFGVYTETSPVKKSLTYEDGSDVDFEYGAAAALHTWNNMTASETPPAASEGRECWSFDIGAGDWFGMGVFLPSFRNMANYSDGYLHFDVKTTSTTSLKVGIKSSRRGESFLPLRDETAEFGFARDGTWHVIEIPMSEISEEVDLSQVSQLFQVLGSTGPISDIEFDDIYFTDGGSP